MSLILFEKLPRAYDLRNLNEADSDDEDYEEEEIDDEADGLDDEADFNDPLNDDQLRAELRGMGVGSLGDEEDEESDAELDIGQFQEFRTKLDADAVDEYQLFSALLEGNGVPSRAARSLRLSSSFPLFPPLSFSCFLGGPRNLCNLSRSVLTLGGPLLSFISPFQPCRPRTPGPLRRQRRC